MLDAVNPERFTECDVESPDTLAFAVCKEIATGVVVPYHTFEVAASFVVQFTVAPLCDRLLTFIPDIFGAVVSGVALVTNDDSDEVAVFPDASCETTKYRYEVLGIKPDRATSWLITKPDVVDLGV